MRRPSILERFKIDMIKPREQSAIYDYVKISIHLIPNLKSLSPAIGLPTTTLALDHQVVMKYIL